MSDLTELFGEPLYTYTRKDALADGSQVALPADHELVKNAGFKVPVFITSTVWDNFVEVPEGVTGQDEKGRLWDVLWMCRASIGWNKDQEKFVYQLHVRNNNRRARLITLLAAMGPVDIDDPSPALTIMMPDEE